MTSSPARGSSTSSGSLSGRSLLARLKSPLQSKTRNFADFYIQPDDPHRQYAPGDIISGAVIIKVLKPLRITHLVISLHGYAQVFKNPNSPGDAYRNYSTTVGSGKGKKGGSYFGNGFASLFEDEAVLCGEGRLQEGLYHFNFELEFPTKGLPSSIDFERGTISYMLTSTLTRPTTISPTTSCDSKVYLMDSIDIAPIPEPKPRVISLEPISRRARKKPSARKRPATITESSQQAPGTSDSGRNGRVSELNGVPEESDGPGSPAPSDTSFESQFSSGNASGTEYGIRSVNTTVDGGSSQSGSRSTFKGKIITATIDVLKGGFLRGDQIPITISVNHTKHVRSLKGIIITLYRQARVDMHPALPVLANSKGDKQKSEDYYPKSRTGLGGLSLSSAGSSHLFRKDLSQSFAPLFVDPRTLTAEVKCSVRVPEEAFPTISNVPGAMISFKYFIEVVVDIQGKLTGLDRMISAGLGGPAPTVGGQVAEEAKGGIFSTWGGNFVDTDAIRREKSVVSCIFEVIIGTKDSERNGKRRQQPDASFDVQPDVRDFPSDPNGNAGAADGTDGQGYYGYDQDGQYYDSYGYDQNYPLGYYDNAMYPGADPGLLPYQPAPPPPMPPNGEGFESGLSEKERLRRAEARLLPSQPPVIAGPSSPSNVPTGIGPSAPVLPEEDEQQPPYFPPEASSSSMQPSQFGPASPSSPYTPTPTSSQFPLHTTSIPIIQRRVTDDESRTVTNGSTRTINAHQVDSLPAAASIEGGETNGARATPSLQPHSPAPEYSASSSSRVHPTDDKQELQRRRLELERSAPPDDREGEATSSAPPVTGTENQSVAASAPVLNEEDEGLVGAMRPARTNGNGSPSETLPVYQR
ncbi:hypothetical protein BU24DRAFT_462224 [Aaosphaeria arxii CBS 175.79]|uniref:Arrestin C-terminal-like domain-containing protein n=1 Tax=Aaosphaeria arxii CBS 175.79 TaxID=1450172 RepID=A0A6A5XTL2_9PLEO|nr:uncharacterized protein BU24DRAFT_462224 [Aaosphaeria arxii CBS 175.79]KAF2016020.1 hypothetical protein BU24DRAFT_462224 [Aaosphaeria arxii CBS 175.79]